MQWSAKISIIEPFVMWLIKPIKTHRTPPIRMVTDDGHQMDALAKVMGPTPFYASSIMNAIGVMMTTRTPWGSIVYHL